MTMKYEWILIPDNDIMDSVVLHINTTKILLITIQYNNYVLSIATFKHSGIDYD